MARLDEMDAIQSEAERQARMVQTEASEWVSGSDEDVIQQDLLDGVSLLSRAKTLLDFMSDPVMLKRFSNKERGAMSRLSVEIKTYLDAVEGVYDSEFEEEEVE